MKLSRNRSLFVEEGRLEELSSIKKFPVFIGATDENPVTDIFSDLTFDICKTTGMIQLRHLVDPKIVYSKFHSEAVGNIWEEHHNRLASIISTYADNKRVLEIGGSDSRLALKTLERNDQIEKWCIIEPNLKNKIDHEKITYIEKFFDDKFHDYKTNLVVHSHVFEHTIFPDEFLTTISNNLDFGDYHIFSVPNLFKYLKNKFVNTINFEHTLFLTETFIDYLLSCNKFKTLRKYYYGEHSIIYVTQKAKVRTKKLPNKYIQYKRMYLSFINYYTGFVKNLNKKLKKTNKRVYLFGGHVFSQYLIALGLDTSKILYILDNSPFKLNKRLYGTNIQIKSPNSVKLDENSLIILKVGQYKDEIKEQLLHINNKIEFYE